MTNEMDKSVTYYICDKKFNELVQFAANTANSYTNILKIKKTKKININNKAKCLNCKKTFSRNDSLKLHILKFHSNNNLRIKCKKEGCDVTFSVNDKAYKKFHEKNHYKPVVYYSCKKCNKQFNKKSNLKRHMKIHDSVY